MLNKVVKGTLSQVSYRGVQLQGPNPYHILAWLIVMLSSVVAWMYAVIKGAITNHNMWPIISTNVSLRIQSYFRLFLLHVHWRVMRAMNIWTRHIDCHIQECTGLCAKALNSLHFRYLTVIFSCDQAAIWLVQSVRPSVRLSVCPSVRLSVRHTFFTMFPSSYHHEIFRSYYWWQKWRPCKRSRSEVKGQGHRGHDPT